MRNSNPSALVAYCGGLILAGTGCPLSHSITPLLNWVGQELHLMGGDKGSLIQQKLGLCAEAKESKEFILCFSSASLV